MDLRLCSNVPQTPDGDNSPPATSFSVFSRTLMECADPLRMNGRRTPPVFSSERNMKWLRGVVTDQ